MVIDAINYMLHERGERSGKDLVIEKTDRIRVLRMT